MSSYTKSLSAWNQTLYISKIKAINDIDPYDCDDTEFSTEISEFPNIGVPDLLKYLVEQKQAYTKEEFSGFRNLEAFKLHENDCILEILVKKIGDNVLVKGKVLHLQKSYEPWLIVNPSGPILNAHCTCQEGFGGACSHVGAVLFSIEDAKVRENLIPVAEVKVEEDSDVEMPVEEITQIDTGPSIRIVGLSELESKKSVIPAIPVEALHNLMRELKNEGYITPYHMNTAPFCFEIAEERKKKQEEMRKKKQNESVS